MFFVGLGLSWGLDKRGYMWGLLVRGVGEIWMVFVDRYVVRCRVFVSFE